MGICTIRLDDITPDMNWENFYRAKEIFDKYQIKPLIGVVPCNQDDNLKRNVPKEEFWEEIRKLQKSGWSIAQHGYKHIYETKDAGLLGVNAFSEFAGLPLELQISKLKKGREILQKEGIYAKIFMAPGHTYDKNTLEALKNLGFKYITDGYSSCSYKWRELVFIPCTISKPKKIKGVDTICLHTNEMTNIEFCELERFFAENKGYVIDFHEVLQKAIPKKRNITVFFNEYANLKKRSMKKFLGTNSVVQEYFVRTNHISSRKKMLRRIIGLPKLLLLLLLKKSK